MQHRVARQLSQSSVGQLQRLIVVAFKKHRPSLVELVEGVLRDGRRGCRVRCNFGLRRQNWLGITGGHRLFVVGIRVIASTSKDRTDGVGGPPRQANGGGYRIVVPKVVPTSPVTRGIAAIPAAVPGIVIVKIVLPIL